MPSRTTTRRDGCLLLKDKYSYSLEANMDHGENWIECSTCGAELMHSDFGPYDITEEEIELHRTGQCSTLTWIAAIAAAGFVTLVSGRRCTTDAASPEPSFSFPPRPTHDESEPF